MLVTPSRLHCVRYKQEFDKQMWEMKLPYGGLVAFSNTVHDTDLEQSPPILMQRENVKPPRASLMRPAFRQTPIR